MATVPSSILNKISGFQVKKMVTMRFQVNFRSEIEQIPMTGFWIWIVLEMKVTHKCSGSGFIFVVHFQLGPGFPDFPSFSRPNKMALFGRSIWFFVTLPLFNLRYIVYKRYVNELYMIDELIKLSL